MLRYVSSMTIMFIYDDIFMIDTIVNLTCLPESGQKAVERFSAWAILNTSVILACAYSGKIVAG